MRRWQIQKSFIHGVTDRLEQTSIIAYVIIKAWLKQRYLKINLLNLNNTLGEVHCNLIKIVLSYHNIPESVKLFIVNLYTAAMHVLFQTVYQLLLFYLKWCTSRGLS